jgi:transcriptional regulator with XRE-family HTH domain
MTQAQLGDLIRETHGLRLDPVTISRLETGNRLIRLNEAVAIADALKIKLWDLIMLPAMSAQSSPEQLQAQARQLARELEQLDARVAKAEASAMDARAQTAKLRRHRDLIAMRLAALTMAPGFPGEGGQQ